MGGEKFRYLRLRKRTFTEEEQDAYTKLLVFFRQIFEQKLVRNEGDEFGSALASYHNWVARESSRCGVSGSPPLKPTRLLVNAAGAVPILLESQRTGVDAGFAKLPSPLVELILGFAYTALGSVQVGRCFHHTLPGPSVHLYVECDRPYQAGALVLQKRLTEDFEFGWQDRSYSKAPDPLRGYADEVMNFLLVALPQVFKEEAMDAWAEDMRHELMSIY